MRNLREIDVDQNDFNESFIEALKLHTFIMDNLKTYPFNNITLTYFDSYYFKIMRTDNLNGVIICIPPYNLNSCEIYSIINNKPNINTCITFMGKSNDNLDNLNKSNNIDQFIISNKNSYKSNNINLYSNEQEYNYNKVMNYVLYTLYCDEIKYIHCDKVYEYIITKNSFNNYNIVKEKKYIKILDNNTQNGYVISFFANEYGPQIKIELYQNKLYYGLHKTCYISSSIDNIYNKLTYDINNNVHNIPIKCCKIVLPKYLEQNKLINIPINHQYHDDPIAVSD